MGLYGGEKIKWLTRKREREKERKRERKKANF